MRLTGSPAPPLSLLPPASPAAARFCRTSLSARAGIKGGGAERSVVCVESETFVERDVVHRARTRTRRATDIQSIFEAAFPAVCSVFCSKAPHSQPSQQPQQQPQQQTHKNASRRQKNRDAARRVRERRQALVVDLRGEVRCFSIHTPFGQSPPPCRHRPRPTLPHTSAHNTPTHHTTHQNTPHNNNNSATSCARSTSS